ncbi:hypothetical protein MRX96_035929 [Rhipicephalus microplus]
MLVIPKGRQGIKLYTSRISINGDCSVQFPVTSRICVGHFVHKKSQACFHAGMFSFTLIDSLKMLQIDASLVAGQLSNAALRLMRTCHVRRHTTSHCWSDYFVVQRMIPCHTECLRSSDLCGGYPAELHALLQQITHPRCTKRSSTILLVLVCIVH